MTTAGPFILGQDSAARRDEDPPLLNSEDSTIPMCVPGADEAIALIRRHHEVWLGTQQNLHRV